MKRLNAHRIGVDQGDLVLFSDFQSGGQMWTGKGARELRRAVTFSEPYLQPPSVTVHLSMWDVSNDANARVELVPDKITETGFEIVFRTWGDTQIARVRAAWQAIGEIAHEDDWQLY